MLADQLMARARRCAELNAMLADQPDGKNAPDWISEISEKALNRREDRHVAIVSQVRKLRRKIAAWEALPDKAASLADRFERLQSRVDEMRPGDPGYERFSRKLKALAARIEDDGSARVSARLPAMRRKLGELSVSPELLTREDVIDG